MENESLAGVLENLDVATLEQLLQARRSNCDENAETRVDTDVPVMTVSPPQPEPVEFDKDVDFLQRQLKNLKDSLKKCLDKRAKLTRSGAAASSLPTCRYFEQMAFLHQSVGNRPTESNLSALLHPATARSPPEATSQCTQPEDAPSAPRTPTQHLQPGDKRPVNSMLFTSNRSGNKMNRDAAELLLLKQLSDGDAMCKKMTEEDNDEDLLYCRSLVPIFKGLPDKKRRLAKIKISQVLFDMKYNDDV